MSNYKNALEDAETCAPFNCFRTFLDGKPVYYVFTTDYLDAQKMVRKAHRECRQGDQVYNCSTCKNNLLDMCKFILPKPINFTGLDPINIVFSDCHQNSKITGIKVITNSDFQTRMNVCPDGSVFNHIGLHFANVTDTSISATKCEAMVKRYFSQLLTSFEKYCVPEIKDKNTQFLACLSKTTYGDELKAGAEWFSKIAIDNYKDLSYHKKCMYLVHTILSTFATPHSNWFVCPAIQQFTGNIYDILISSRTDIDMIRLINERCDTTRRLRRDISKEVPDNILDTIHAKMGYFHNEHLLVRELVDLGGKIMPEEVGSLSAIPDTFPTTLRELNDNFESYAGLEVEVLHLAGFAKSTLLSSKQPNGLPWTKPKKAFWAFWTGTPASSRGLSGFHKVTGYMPTEDGRSYIYTVEGYKTLPTDNFCLEPHLDNSIMREYGLYFAKIGKTITMPETNEPVAGGVGVSLSNLETCNLVSKITFRWQGELYTISKY
jgi:hypothetical protein